VWVIAALSIAGSASARPPNILLIMAEDLSPRTRSFGDPVGVAPNIDALAAEGVRYTRVFTTAGVGAPSRAALILGMHQQSTRTMHMRASGYGAVATSGDLGGYEAVPPAHAKAFPELLRAAGYRTLNIGKTDYQFGDPFTIWDRDTGFAGDSSDLELVDGDEPFFAYLNLGQTHESGLFPRRFPRSGLEAVVGLARLYAYGWQSEPVVAPEAIRVPPYYPDTPTVRRTIARQYTNQAQLDQEVGEIRAWLERSGLRDSTIVIWTTDHGDGLPRAKRELYDSGIHVPLIIDWPEALRPPGAAPGAQDSRLVSFVDLAPTILDWAGVQAPGWMQGQVFAGEGAAPPRRYVHAAKDRIDAQPERSRAVRDERFKYIRNAMPELPNARHMKFRDNLAMMRELWAMWEAGELNETQRIWFEAPRAAEELYDTQADPDEVRNLVADAAHSATLTRLRAEMARFEAAIPDYGALPEAEMIESIWPGGEQPPTASPEIVRGADGRVLLSCDTEGASLGYQLGGDGRGVEWRLYTGPIEVAPGVRIEAKAIRYGYAESPVVRLAP
jgi:arylsulfatase A-like enzyme